MSPLIFLILAQPTASDRAVDPVAIEAPATEPEPAAPAPTQPPADPTTGTINPWTAPIGSPAAIQPQPYRPPPPPPPPVKYADRPIRHRVDLYMAVGAQTHRDPAWRAFGDRVTTNFSLGVRADFRLATSRLFLGGGLGFRRFSDDSVIHGALSTRARVREPLAFLRLSVVAREGLDMFIQAGGGPSVVDLDFSTGRAEQRSVAAMVDGLAGLALYLPKRWLPRRGSSRISGGLELAAGYIWRSRVDVRPDYITDEDPIPTSSASLGDVSLRGITWRLGLFLRFQ